MLTVTHLLSTLPGRRWPSRSSSGAFSPKRALPAAGIAATLILMAIGSTSPVLATTHVTVTFAALDKTYDGTTGAAIDTDAGCSVVTDTSPDTIGCEFVGTPSGTFGSRDVGTHIVGADTSYFKLTGTNSENYTIDSASSSADITPRDLHVTATGGDKIYNGDADTSVTLHDDRVSGDTLSETYTTATFPDKKVGTSRTVSVSGIVLVSGGDSTNYNLVNTTTTSTADITPRDLHVTATADNKTYDGNATATAHLSDDKVSGDSFTTETYATALFPNKNAGVNRTVTVSGISIAGGDASNYHLANSSTTATATIFQRAITVTAVANAKTADGDATAANPPSVSPVGSIQTGDTANFVETYFSGDAAPLVASGDAGYPLWLKPSGTVTDGNSGNNYSYTFVPQKNGRIRPAAVASLAFTVQPIDTKIGTPILASCDPGGSSLGPCATTSALVTVRARDRYLNLAGRDAPGDDGTVDEVKVIIKDNASNQTIGPSAGTATVRGFASFNGTLIRSDSYTGHMKLVASTTSPSTTSQPSVDFRIVNDLASCGTAPCVTKANEPSSKVSINAWNQITGSFSGAGTLQTTSFVADGGSKDNGTTTGCNTGRTYIGDGFDQRVFAAPSTGIRGYQLVVIPKNTLKGSGVLSRGTPSFDVCFGAIWVGDASHPAPASGWTGKPTPGHANGSSVIRTDDGVTRYWGLPLNCPTSGVPSGDPCIALRTKQRSDVVALIPSLSSTINSLMFDGDLAMVVRVGGTSATPITFWDGGGHGM